MKPSETVSTPNYKCPQCLNTVKTTLDWSGVAEYSTGNEQTCTISCDTCCFQISITIDPDKEIKSRIIEEGLIKCWKELYEISL